MNTCYNKGSTALISASTGGHLDVVKTLLENKANLEIKSIEGYTALIWASRSGHLDIVKTLLEHKANIEATDKYGLYFCYC